ETGIYAGQEALATNTFIEGGTQYVEDATARNTKISKGGIQYLRAKALADITHIEDGVQYIYADAQAKNTTIKSLGSQMVYTGGTATDTTIKSGGIQWVESGGTTTDTTINGGQSWLRAGAVANGETSVNAGGELLMDAGSLATDVNISGGTLSVSDLSDATSGQNTVQVGMLTMDGGNVNFLRNSDGEFAKLTITELSGTGNFLLNTSLADRKGNFVTIEQGTGQFGIAVADSGKEISDHTDLTLNLIHEKGGDIDFEMVTASGRSTRFVDGGTYMYTLYSQQDKDGLTGGNVWYLGAMGSGGENPGGENPGGENPGGENPGGENPGGENPGGENPGGENPGGETPGGENPGGENPGGENPGGENPGGEIPGGENPGGENPGGENPGGENPGGENPGGGDNGNAGGNGNGGKKPMTTPATDAILAMSNAGLNVIHSELDGLRTYRASLDKTGPESNVWGHYLGSKSDIDTSNGAAYKLSQNGLEIGADTRTDFDRGSLVTGTFMSFSDNKVKHARGGTSKIDSYGLGLYATWYDVSGFYADGVVKGNRLNNKLRAVMTNGGRTGGDWTQYALSTAVEGGYQFDLKDDVSITPYARLAFVQMTSEEVKLSNGMKGNTGTPRSVTGEAGAKLAGKFSIGSTEFKPYLSAAVLQEFANSNEVTINERNRFDNNVKGTSGKYGLGASVNVGKDVTLYGEANYRQGSQIETPIQGVAGIRIGF
ncbi:autotransporter outer membrane beta-barrel domain-containing protein, partial [Enterobacter roggenkampii]|nr:autotransporter outer membrane beta-barrel domain-containing protein [Enterobacter roggenkampii]